MAHTRLGIWRFPVVLLCCCCFSDAQEGALNSSQSSPSDFKFYECDGLSPREGEQKRVVAFHHVYKTAGSTIRSLFRQIAGKRCKFGYATVVSNDQVKEMLSRNGQRIIKRPVRLKNVLDEVRNHVDIVGGHQRFDTVHRLWPAMTQDQIGRIVFVRSPLTRFISGLVYGNKKNDDQPTFQTEADVLREISIVADETPNAINNVYWKYLSNETQNMFVANSIQVEIIKANLNMCQVVGVVEQWSDSLDLMRSLLDRSNMFEKKFDSLKGLTKNEAKLSTSKIALMLTDRPATMQKIKHLLRFEEEIYQHGLNMHAAQINVLKAKALGVPV